jgi:hypothetical protein
MSLNRWCLLAPLALAACGGSDVNGALLALGEPATTAARLERRVTVAFGGYAWWIEIDSLTATLRVRCELLGSGIRAPGGCASIPTDITRQLSRATVTRLYSDATSNAFGSLRPEYDMSGTFVDGPAYSVTITANGRTRQIRWSDTAMLPPILRQWSDDMFAAAQLPGR